MLYYMGYYRLQNREGLIFMRNIVGVVCFQHAIPCRGDVLGREYQSSISGIEITVIFPSLRQTGQEYRPLIIERPCGIQADGLGDWGDVYKWNASHLNDSLQIGTWIRQVAFRCKAAEEDFDATVEYIESAIAGWRNQVEERLILIGKGTLDLLPGHSNYFEEADNVTGLDLFLEDDYAATRESLSLQHSTVPIVGRADQLSGIDFTKLDFDALVAAGKKVFLFLPDDKDVELLDAEDQAYIDFGVSKKYNEGYKCKNRKRWYVVPQAWEPEAFMLRQVHKYPKIVFNDTGAQSTDTLHKIRFLDGVDGRIVAGAFLNSFTLALCEIIGRSYGGGVLTFEPGEVRRLLIPMVNAEQLDFTLIDRLARNKQIEALLEYTDRTLLEFGLGMSYEEVLAIRGIWERLSHRRIGRKRK